MQTPEAAPTAGTERRIGEVVTNSSYNIAQTTHQKGGRESKYSEYNAFWRLHSTISFITYLANTYQTLVFANILLQMVWG